jgi:outer membrane protein OmpA-like peptidoglycan-associated protein/Mg-chelatase subunit ChlD
MFRRNQDMVLDFNIDTTGYFVPNKNSTDYGFVSIDDMLKNATIKESNTFKEIDSVLKNVTPDNSGKIQAIQRDTLIDSNDKKTIKEVRYTEDTASKMLIKSEVLFDTNGKELEMKAQIYHNDTSISASAKSDKLFGIIPFVRNLTIKRTIEVSDNTDSIISDYKIDLTNLDDTYYPDSIILNLTIQNKYGEFISGLAEPYLPKDKKQNDYWKFVNENCREINDTISNIKVEEIRDIKFQKNNICFVLDHSGSMGEERCVYLQQAVYYVSKTLNEADYLSAIKFTNRPIVEVEPTGDKEIFRKQFKINGMGNYGEGGTDILQALDSSVSVLLRGPDNYSKIVVLFTDGESDMKRYKDVMKKLISNKCRVFTICYGAVNMKLMKQIAKETNGRTYKIKDVRDFADAFKEIYSTLTNYYKVVYTPFQCSELHKINLNLELPSRNNDGNIINVNYIVESEYDKSVLVDYADVGTMTFLDIEFEYNKATIDSASIPKLMDIVNQLKRNRSVNIQIAGHTDGIGTDEYNQKLSLERANSVKSFLVKNGIDKNRINTFGYGKSKPLVPNDTDENRRKNRRTEFIVIE